MTMLLLVACAFSYVVTMVHRRYFTCPSHLRHLPRLPIWPMLKSFVSGEPESTRIRNLILPFADAHGHRLVLIWVLGDWYVHIIDPTLARRLMEEKSIEKHLPFREMLFWKLSGYDNVLTSETSSWARQAPAVREVLKNNTPVDLFAALVQRLFSRIGPQGGRVRWEMLANAFTLDGVGAAVIGWEFNALSQPDNPIVQTYKQVMHATAEPLYMAFPSLEHYFPRTQVLKKFDTLVKFFLDIIEEKKVSPGNDFISSLLALGHLSQQQLRDNTIAMFMAGHDTTAGALSSLVVYLAKYPEYQTRARAEARSVLGKLQDPFELTSSNLHEMPFIGACVRESMRMNCPAATTLPRVSPKTIHLEGYTIPPETPTLVNMYATSLSSQVWKDPHVFSPERFLNTGAMEDNRTKPNAMNNWIPFGVGSRRCPASNFAITEQRTLLALLLYHYEWTLPEDSIHLKEGGIKNASSAFSLNLPYNVDLEFVPYQP